MNRNSYGRTAASITAIKIARRSNSFDDDEITSSHMNAVYVNLLRFLK